MITELDLRSLWSELDAYEREVQKEASTLSDVWVKMAQLKEKNEEETRVIMAQKEFTFIPPDAEIIFNVGGQIFETTAGVLTKDPYSVLAAYCRSSEHDETTPPEERLFEAEARSGIFFIDRDWWLFRHILTYLRSNVLPNEYETLKELYVEAAFYRLESLQTAIENLPVDQVTNLSSQVQKTYPGFAGAGDAAQVGLADGATRAQSQQNVGIHAQGVFAGAAGA
jgi:hypothetical protein